MSGNSHSTSNCVVKPPAKQPTPLYLPDGSMSNTLYQVPENKGWFTIYFFYRFMLVTRWFLVIVDGLMSYCSLTNISFYLYMFCK